MASTYLEIILLSFILLSTSVYLKWRRKSPAKNIIHANGHASLDNENDGQTRNIKDALDRSNKNCIIFYGSQTGTAEEYASKLAKEGKTRFGLDTMIADLDEYDFNTLDMIPEDKVVMFVLATYGEGEPTDNAVQFYEFLTGENIKLSESNKSPLGNLSYVAFGLGNNTYEHYNAVVRNVDKALGELGASRIGEIGEGDDGAGTTEEDFLAWKESMWGALSQRFRLTERDSVFESSFRIMEHVELESHSPEIYLGEPNKSQLEDKIEGPFNAHNPFIAPISASRELFNVKDRSCLHIEVDLGESGLTYQTGDHIAIWPLNPSGEVDRCCDILGLREKRDAVISIESLELTTRLFFPTPTTYETIIRYHLEICAPVSRQFVSTLAMFSPDEETKKEMTKLGSDKEYFQSKTDGCYYTTSQFLDMVSKGQKWTKIPFSAWIEGLSKLQPRYYSISSSSQTQPDMASITTVVEKKTLANQEREFYGVATNYLLYLKRRQNHDPVPRIPDQTYEIKGPRNKKSTEDFIYQSDFESYGKILGDRFELITAFSRQSPKKVYVQDCLWNRRIDVNDLIQQKGYFYVCGDAANMARQVSDVLMQIIEEQRSVSREEAEDIIKEMRVTSKYQNLIKNQYLRSTRMGLR
ncbi:hypothetical protein G7Z17_g3764 [Cylindrodendrum hubeiense]|uniref:NADPH--hemoprotein reductase n=1 Tax=Cylindrodendrum hubeiense TaxID=595255 RepID=A0A9P5HG81_9HYPO|nr:hypothetical protein G7Z17_g3764 [Cylindrodendrum hubeiense]